MRRYVVCVASISISLAKASFFELGLVYPPSFDINKFPSGLSNIRLDTTTARTTPKISITTWMVVELCAGSTRSFFMINGKIAPKQTLLKTIIARAAVTASVSGNGVRKAAARIKPAEDKIPDRAPAIFNSRVKN